MPAFRLVYVHDEIGRPQTLTAAFASRTEAEAALIRRGLRVLHVAELRAGESASNPIVVPMAAGAVAPPSSPALGTMALAGAR